MITLDQIKAALPLLTNYELGEIRQQITVLMSLGGGAAKPPSNQDRQGPPGQQPSSTDHTDEDFVLQSVCRVVRLSNGSPVQPQMLKRASGTMATLREHLPDLIQYLDVISPAARPGFLDMAVQLLMDEIKKWNVPVTPVTVIRQLHRLPACVDEAFPGYYRAGMLGGIFSDYQGRKSDGHTR